MDAAETFDIRVTPGIVSDAAGTLYPNDTIPDPEEHAKYASAADVLSQVPDGLIGRVGNHKAPLIRKGITIPRGQSREFRGVSGGYVKLLKMDHHRSVEIVATHPPAAPTAAQAQPAQQPEPRRDNRR